MKTDKYEFGHMTNMAAMPVYGKIIKKTFSRTNGLIALKLGMRYWGLGPMVVYSNDDWLDLDSIYVKVKFGRVCFCMGKSGNC